MFLSNEALEALGTATKTGESLKSNTSSVCGIKNAPASNKYPPKNYLWHQRAQSDESGNWRDQRERKSRGEGNRIGF